MLVNITVDAATTYQVNEIFYQVYHDNPEEVMVVKPDNSTHYSGVINIPDSVTYHNEEETIKAAVVAINDRAFEDCHLTKLTLSASMETIGNNAFNGCTIDTLILESWKQLCENINYNYYSSNPLTYTKHLYFSSKLDEEVTEWVIPEGITKINPYAFYGLERMTSVTLPASLTEIGHYAFENCTGLTGISIPASVTTIGDRAFMNCTKITQVEFSENALLETIGQYAFYGCTTLSEISIPASVNSIGSQAFAGCTNMKNQKAIFASAEALCKITFEDKYANPLYIAHHLYYQGNSNEITALVLPENEEIKKINASAFAGGENIITVTIPGNVKRFGDDAFLDCKSLQSVTFADIDHIIDMVYDNEYASPLRYAKYAKINNADISSVEINKDISENLFANAVWLENVTIGSGCKKIGKAAFKGCKWLTNVTIEDGLEEIDNDAFKDCTNLENINLPSTLNRIGTQAFRACYQLKEITIPVNIETLGTEIFMYSGLKSATIASTNIDKVPVSCFSNCSALENVQLSETIKTIEREAFSKCSSLTTLPAGDAINTIKNNAFAECKGIKTLELPSTVRHIYPNAFSKCEGLTRLIIKDSGSPAQEDRLDIQSGAFADCKNLQFIISYANPAPDANSNAFGGKTDIQLYHNDGATGYGENPWSNFSGSSITEHTITYKVDGKVHKTIGYKTGDPVTPLEEPTRDGWDFSGWQGEIPDVMLADSIVINGYFTKKQQIGNLYYHLDPMTAKATVIYHNSYKNLTNIGVPESVTFEATEYYENSTYQVKAIADGAFEKCEKMKGITIANSITSIGKGAFKDCTELYEKVILPTDVTVLSDSLFYNCKNLIEVKMSDKVTEIGASAFNQCTNLELSTLPATVQKIGTLAFRNCKVNITEFTIPASVTEFADRVFLGCEALEKVTFEEGCQLATLPAYTFQNCYNLKEIPLASSMNLIEVGAFENCRSLAIVKIPESIIIGRIKENAFSGCSGITQINIPESVKALGGQAFKGCTKIKTVILDDTTPPSAPKTLFDDAIYSSAKLYFPTGAQNYGSTQPWSLFQNRIERTDYSVTYMVDGEPYGEKQTCQSGATINLINEPSIEGRKFSGWEGIPANQTMPNENVTITGKFQYVITYKDFDGDTELCKDSLWCGDKIVAPAKLDSLSYTYQLDPELELMPARDTTITVTYLVSECEYVYNGIRYYIYTQGENPHAEIMAGQTPYSNVGVIIPQTITYKGETYPVTVIRNDAFKNCANLTTVTFEESSNIQQIRTQAFSNCNKLTEIHIPKSVETLGNECFMRCGSLQSVTFEEGSALTTIANAAFMGCRSLDGIVIPESVNMIDHDAFQYCDKLMEITIANSTTLPSAYENTFEEETYNNANLYTSVGELSEPCWSKFQNVVVEGGTSIEQCAKPVITYGAKDASDKLAMTCETEGATIVTSIQVQDVQKSETAEITLIKKFTVTAYAKKAGMRRSETVIQTFYYEVGDVNHDGKITAIDGSLILQKVAGKIE